MRTAALALAVLAACALAWDEGLRDVPMGASSITYLDGQWGVAGAGHSFSGSVPGDLFSDLEEAGIIPDPIVNDNWLLNSSLWAKNTFNYSTSFSLTEAEAASGQSLLVFDGIKMGANVFVNGKKVGTVVDQFLRYVFPLDGSSSVRAGSNSLVVSFDPSIGTDGGRFMACTGGWDWAPYSDQQVPAQPDTAHAFSKGIWKSVYVAGVESAAITHFVPQTYYQGEYVIEPLKDGEHAGFVVKSTVHFWAASEVSGTLEIKGSWGGSGSSSIKVPAGESNATVTITATAAQIKLWWPNGLGSQPLYTVTATFTPSSGSSSAVSATRSIGFKYFVLVTGDDTAPGYIEKNKNADGNDQNGMFFRVNGAAFLARGANMIPMDEMEGRINSTAVRIMVQSAVDANFNMLRIWGGGVFQYDAFYSACDELGILIYHDMQYAQQGHSPSQTDTQAAEFRHQVRRLSSHVSIGLYDGCNECHVVIGTGTGIYATFVLTVVAEEDTSHVIWPSCPADGWKAGVNRLTSMPNGSPLGLLPNARPPQFNSKIETHGPYQHGNGFPAVNGGGKLQPFDPKLPISVKATGTGVNYTNVFASEFGCVSMSSFESMSPTLSPQHWALHAGQPDDDCNGGFASTCKGPNVMAQRNYPMDNLLDVYFGDGDAHFLNTTGEAPFKKQLWESMISAALNIKSNIEGRRQTNQFGIIVWQYGEIWPTGGWGSVEYSSPRPGQVLGGRWKPLQYWYKKFLYQDVIAACGMGECYVRNSRSMQTFEGKVTVSALALDTGKVTQLKEVDLSMAAGPGISTFFSVDMSSLDVNKTILIEEVTDASGGAVMENFNLLAPPKYLSGVQKSTTRVTVADKLNPDGSVDVTVTSQTSAVWVTVTTMANGRFSDNAFVMPPGSRTLQFIPFGAKEADLAELKATIRVEDFGSYI